MKTIYHRLQAIPAPPRYFHLGEVKILDALLEAINAEESIDALTRHSNCDFGQVSLNHHSANLSAIARRSGTVTSVYSTRFGQRFYVMTWLDDFEPRTKLMLP